MGSDFSDVIIGMSSADGTVGGESQVNQTGTITVNAGDGTLNFSPSNLNLRGVTGTTTITSAIDTSGVSGKTLTVEGTAINLNGDLTTDGGLISFTGPVTVNKGSATAVGTGAGGGDVTFGSTLTLSSGGNDDLTITAGTGQLHPDRSSCAQRWRFNGGQFAKQCDHRGISGSTGALDITDSGTTDINGDLAMSGTRNNHPGCSKFGSEM